MILNIEFMILKNVYLSIKSLFRERSIKFFLFFLLYFLISRGYSEFLNLASLRSTCSILTIWISI